MAIDRYGRNIDYLRVSITDRCNLNCKYCMPDGVCNKLSHNDILTYEEITKIIKAFTKLGITKIKITGGEPLVRKDSYEFINSLKTVDGIKEVTITTNGILLDQYVDGFIENGIDGINISLDTLNKEKFKGLTGGNLDKVKQSIHDLIDKGYKNLKINSVIIKDFNEDEIIDLAKLAKNNDIAVRFIELMPIGNAKKFEPLKRDYILSKLEKEFGKYSLYDKKIGNGPADYITFDNFKGKIGFIDAIDHKFCKDCNRVRLTSTGKLKLCLQYDVGIDLKDFAKGDITEEEFLEKIRKALMIKPKENSFKDLDNIIGENTNTMNEIGG